MLLSIALILLCGMSMSWICKKLKLPGLLGMLLTGIVLGPYVLNLLDENILNQREQIARMKEIQIVMKRQNNRIRDCEKFFAKYEKNFSVCWMGRLCAGLRRLIR